MRQLIRHEDTTALGPTNPVEVRQKGGGSAGRGQFAIAGGGWFCVE